MADRMKVTQLFVYPVKGLGGISLQSSTFSHRGLDYDRQWMLVDQTGMFVTQRQVPKLALFKTHLHQDKLELRFEGDQYMIPFSHKLDLTLPVTVWKSHILALDEGEDVSKWITSKVGEFRGNGLRLVRFKPDEIRSVSDKYITQSDGAQHYYFADGFPFLIATEQTLTKLNQILNEKKLPSVTIDRFRPNIVFDKLDKPFSELYSQDLVSLNQKIAFSIRKPCERCPVTTVDQITGNRPIPNEPLETLRQLNPLDIQGAYFGGNGILVSAKSQTIQINTQWKSCHLSERLA